MKYKYEEGYRIYDEKYKTEYNKELDNQNYEIVKLNYIFGVDDLQRTLEQNAKNNFIYNIYIEPKSYESFKSYTEYNKFESKNKNKLTEFEGFNLICFHYNDINYLKIIEPEDDCEDNAKLIKIFKKNIIPLSDFVNLYKEIQYYIEITLNNLVDCIYVTCAEKDIKFEEGISEVNISSLIDVQGDSNEDIIFQDKNGSLLYILNIKHDTIRGNTEIFALTQRYEGDRKIHTPIRKNKKGYYIKIGGKTYKPSDEKQLVNILTGKDLMEFVKTI